MANISLTAPTDYSAELEDIQRRRKLAELMQMQSMQPLESPRPAGGWEIPLSPLSGVAKMVQAYGGSKGLESAKTRQQALAERLRGERAQDYSTLAGAMQPTPEKSLAADPLEADLGGGQYEPPQPMTIPARPAGVTEATIRNLRTPEAQQAGMGMMAKQSEPYSLAPDATRYVGNKPVAKGAPRTVAKPADPEIMRLQTALSLLPEGDPNRAALENRIRNLAKPEPTYKEPELLGGAYVQRENRPGGKVNQVVGRPQQVNTQTSVNVPPPSKVFENENKLRDDYTVASKPFVGIRDAYNTIKASLAGPITAVSTLAGATKFMKMIDPESVVRESELQMALKAAGLWDRFTNLHNWVMKGQVLTATQATQIKEIADVLYSTASQQQQKLDQYYGGLATQYGLEPARVTRNQSAVMAAPSGIDPKVWAVMTPEEKALWQTPTSR